MVCKLYICHYSRRKEYRGHSETIVEQLFNVAHVMEKYSKYEMLHKAEVMYLENAPESIYYLKDSLQGHIKASVTSVYTIF